jgi:hypothetical protein
MSEIEGYYRGSFACVGSDDRIYTIEAKVSYSGAVMLKLDDGRLVRRILKGRYATCERTPLLLQCDHPDAP